MTLMHLVHRKIHFLWASERRIKEWAQAQAAQQSALIEIVEPRKYTSNRCMRAFIQINKWLCTSRINFMLFLPIVHSGIGAWRFQKQQGCSNSYFPWFDKSTLLGMVDSYQGASMFLQHSWPRPLIRSRNINDNCWHAIYKGAAYRRDT